MDIGYKTTVFLPFEEAVLKTIASLKKYNFGIITDIDVKKTMKEKLGLDFKNYRILGACNPALAHTALSACDDIGLLMPCNVVVYENMTGEVVVSTILPTTLFTLLPDDETTQKLAPLAQSAQTGLKNAIDDIGGVLV